MFGIILAAQEPCGFRADQSAILSASLAMEVRTEEIDAYRRLWETSPPGPIELLCDAIRAESAAFLSD